MKSILLFFFVLCSAAHAQPREMRELTLSTGGVLKYAIVLPDGFDASKPFPVLLALPPGAQNAAMVDSSLRMYWEAQAKKRGWVVVSPSAPAGALLVNRQPALLELLDALPKIVTPTGKIHLAGVSNGGIAAIRLAGNHPERFASLLVMPGVPAAKADWGLVPALSRIPVMIKVGEHDQPVWVNSSRRLDEELRAAGGSCELEIIPDGGHVIKADPAALFDWMEKTDTPPAITPAQRDAARLAIEQALNDFHDAAAKADKPRYLGHFAPNAVFLGTDPGERWTLDEFSAYVSKYFDAGTGWAYTPVSRTIDIGDDANTAWFDERVDNAKYGVCRGTGVLVNARGQWKIAQYSLSLPVPNDLMPKVIQLIRDADRK